ncbi:MAG: hypothetical protein A2X61_10235 [Ignavibacteria bacterium GWB2_35_12]|nr:MAG: hypothetical protein A2X63_08365 [Ignavibacteria bacterium GWA2_35_8]OGU39742.1 MAG: hypothetical protein A2X61_10235 [Ignavibacteria bacterium GWB2_35_12]OGU91232.1 MAG: hypothetical protein A2220_16510 [Ignavibacteria bacterium RIFOXYA2_FULL_35_10]OGV21367.1 MAG: hypothetical protein A2475_15045 [Ignavibacteria bacterium RIFOXYC2_FULL_35_21]
MRNLFKITILVFLNSIIFVNGLLADSSVSTTSKEADTRKSELFMIADVKLGKEASDLTLSKVESAMALAGSLTERFHLVPFSMRDSIAQTIVDQNKAPTAAAIAEKLNVNKILFLNINRVENMLRVDISAVDADDFDEKTEGTGYALLHFIKEKDEQVLYDPSLLAAVQRAVAVCLKDSMMYASLDGKFNVIPAPTLIIGGIDFQDDEELYIWDLYSRMAVASYDMLETIFETAKDCRDFVIYDIATRDTIYKLFKLYFAENYRAPSKFEMEILGKFQVDYYITGTLKRVKEGAELELGLYKIKDEKLYPVRFEKGILKEDDIYKLRELTSSLTEQLLKL